MVLKIVHYNQPVLRKKGLKVTAFNTEVTQLAADMVDTMHSAGGIGLAAQQIGKALQLCVIDLTETDREFKWELDGARPPLELFMPLTLVNPILTLLKSPEVPYEEGCLSFPQIRGDVVRPDAVSVKFQDTSGTSHLLTCTGLFARCLQHEIDHLNGVLFIDRMDKKVRSNLDRPVKELAKRTREASPTP